MASRRLMGSLSRSTSTSPFSMALPLSLASLNLLYYSNKTKLDGSIWRTEDKGGHSSGHGQIRMQIPDVRVLGVRFREEARDGKGMGGHNPVGYSSPAKRPAKNWRAAPLALSSPLGKAETEREREKSGDGRRDSRPEQGVFVSTSDELFFKIILF